MLMRTLSALTLVAALAACGGNPLTTGAGPTDPTDPTDPNNPDSLVPATVSQDVKGAEIGTWTSGAPKLHIKMDSIILPGGEGDLTQDPTLNVAGYEAYSYQSTTSNRKVVALVKKSGGIGGMIAVDAGQFSTYRGGGYLWRADTFTKPVDSRTDGVGAKFDYSGSYVGMLNSGPATPGGPGGTLNPSEAYKTAGRVLITADFSLMKIEGGVDNRTNVDTGTALPDIALVETDITADGTFAGTVERLDPTWTTAGNYGGAFSNLGTDVGVVMVFNPTSDPDLVEHGLIVLPGCLAGGPACP